MARVRSRTALAARARLGRAGRGRRQWRAVAGSGRWWLLSAGGGDRCGGECGSGGGDKTKVVACRDCLECSPHMPPWGGHVQHHSITRTCHQRATHLCDQHRLGPCSLTAACPSASLLRATPRWWVQKKWCEKTSTRVREFEEVGHDPVAILGRPSAAAAKDALRSRWQPPWPTWPLRASTALTLRPLACSGPCPRSGVSEGPEAKT